MIKVLNVISDTNIGGAGRCLLNFLKYYDRSRFEVKVVLPHDSLLAPQVQALGVPVIEADGLGEQSLSLTGIRALRKIIRAEKPAIVHTHGAMSGRIAARGTGAKIVYTRHSAFPLSPRMQKGLGRFVYKTVNELFADRIIAVSEASRVNLLEGGIDPEMIDTMMNGVEPVPRLDPSECAALRREYGIPDNAFVTGILARIEEYKGHRYILEALRLLRDQGREVYLLVGGTGGYEEEVKALCHEMGLDPYVRFFGLVTEIDRFLSLLDLQLNASYVTETSSLSVLEGLSMGLPAVVSNCAGNPWVIDDGDDGLLFTNQDSADLAAKIAQLMDDPDTLHRMGRRAGEIYSQRFTGEIFARNVEAVYDKVLEV